MPGVDHSVRSYLLYAERYVVLNAGWYGLLRAFSILFKKRKIKEVYESWVERIYILVHFNLVRVRQSWGWDFMFPGWWPLGHDLLADFSWETCTFSPERSEIILVNSFYIRNDVKFPFVQWNSCMVGLLDKGFLSLEKLITRHALKGKGIG